MFQVKGGTQKKAKESNKFLFSGITHDRDTGEWANTGDSNLVHNLWAVLW